eukprot:CAMPEP_0180550464 /NCGR_PEP_ID=MMETSP1036_2-20121128/72671_1 /TAXON_ID=632150 /ORGANISM="Azadinium spinosum, Strain 3D9" /LENGTH=122 /DNA_ID=CAMNT_0022565743 /DNA_START=244 /DNA_END=612 /DNA_ORIENTATION=+
MSPYTPEEVRTIEVAALDWSDNLNLAVLDEVTARNTAITAAQKGKVTDRWSGTIWDELHPVVDMGCMSGARFSAKSTGASFQLLETHIPCKDPVALGGNGGEGDGARQVCSLIVKFILLIAP